MALTGSCSNRGSESQVVPPLASSGFDVTAGSGKAQVRGQTSYFSTAGAVADARHQRASYPAPDSAQSVQWATARGGTVSVTRTGHFPSLAGDQSRPHKLHANPLTRSTPQECAATALLSRPDWVCFRQACAEREFG
jgi:hypothetical protein